MNSEELNERAPLVNRKESCSTGEEEHLLKDNIFVWPFQRKALFSGVLILTVIVFVTTYFSLEVYELTTFASNTTLPTIYDNVNHSLEATYLILAIIALVVYIFRFQQNRNTFYETDFNNCPMLIAMIVCALIDVSHHLVHLTRMMNETNNASKICSTLAELLFSAGLLPFTIISVCYRIRPNELKMKVQGVVTIVIVLGGCLMIFIRTVCMKIRIDRIADSRTSSHEPCNIYENVQRIGLILELVNITYIVMGLVFLIDPLLEMLSSRLSGGSHPSDNITRDRTFLQSISLVKYRWPTFTLSVLLMHALVIQSYMVSNIPSSYSPSSLQIFMYFVMGANIIGIFYALVYYFYDIRWWSKRDTAYTRNDSHFNNISSWIQIIYAGCMITLCITSFDKGTSDHLLIIQIAQFILLAVQVATQACCIQSAIRRDVGSNQILDWRSKLYPPVALASINFTMMIVLVLYSQSDTFISSVRPDWHIVFFIIKDITLPITILNRVHAMAFFINLSRQQWFDPLVIN